MNKKTYKTIRTTTYAITRLLSFAAKIIGTVLLILITTGAILACIFAVYVNTNIYPQLDLNLDDFTLDLTSFVYYTDPDTGEIKELERLYDAENRIWASYDEIPKNMINATIAIEDERFMKHKGVDWWRTTAAVGNMFLSMKDSFGGSTLTQQLIKNLTDDDEVTVQRKIIEIFRALDFEKNYKKEEILEWYLNIIPLGGRISGVRAASHAYFGKELQELSLAECAAIVGITNNPSRYYPFTRPENNKERQELILGKMLELGYITKSEHDKAVAEKLVFESGQGSSVQSFQSYFVDQIITDVINDLRNEKGLSKESATRLLYRGGYKIYATIDTNIQAIVDEVYNDEDNFPKVVGTAEMPESSMLIMDPYTGYIVAMVGGRGEKTADRVLNRSTGTFRQPGSAIKPVSVYAPALDLGLITPYSVFDDAPVTFNNNNPWPKNQNRTYRGRTTVVNAVELSTNTVAAAVVNMMSPERAFNFAYFNLNMLSLVEQKQIGDKIYTDIGLSPMALGGLTNGVSVRELTAAYASFSNRGVYTAPKTYTKVVDSNGNTVLDNTMPATTIAMKEKTANYINEMLQSVVTRGTGTRAKLSNMPVAGKTGTTDNDHDRWFVGYTPYYAAAVWFGFDEPQEINLEKTINPSLAIWTQVMTRVHENLERREFFEMTGMVSASFCLDSGMLPTAHCKNDIRGSRVATGRYYKDDVPKQSCTVHTPVYTDSESGKLATPFCPLENIITSSMLNISRNYPVSVSVGDSAYIVRDYESSYATSPDSFCPLHTEHGPVTPETPAGGDTPYDGYEIDPVTGYPIDPETGMLVNPLTGELMIPGIPHDVVPTQPPVTAEPTQPPTTAPPGTAPPSTAPPTTAPTATLPPQTPATMEPTRPPD